MSLPRTLSAGAPYAVLSSTPGNAKPIFRTVSKLIVPLAMGEGNYPPEHHSRNSYYSFAYEVLACLRSRCRRVRRNTTYRQVNERDG